MPAVTDTARDSADERLPQLLAGLTAVRGGDFSPWPPMAGDPLMNEMAWVFTAVNEHCLAAGASSYLAKPVGTEEPLGCMERWLAVRADG